MANIQVEQYRFQEMRRRSNSADARIRQMQQNLDSARARADAAVEAVRQRNAASAREIEKELQYESLKLTKEIEGLQQDFGKALGLQNIKLRSQMDEIRASVQESSAQLHALHAKIDETAKKFDKELKAVMERIAGQKERAQAYLNQLDVLLEQIGVLHPDKLAPSRANQIREYARFVKADIVNGDSQAAIGLAQTAIQEAVRLIADLERMNAEFDALSIRVQESCLAVAARIAALQDMDANQKTIVLGEADAAMEFPYNGDLAFWSSGIFPQLCEAYASDEMKILHDFLPQMDLENLRIADRSIPDYLARIDFCQKLADDEFAISCSVQQMAMRIYHALTDDGSWLLTDSGFENNDIRRSYTEIFADALGNTAQVIVLPERRSLQSAAAFSVGAFGAEPEQSGGKQQVLLRAILARLDASGIDTKGCQDLRGTHGNQTAFTEAGLAAGEKMKRSRLEHARRDIIPETNETGGKHNEQYWI